MEAIDAAIASGDDINGLGTHFMLDLATYAHGETLGYSGADFYIAGRGGALGEVPAGVVAAAFVFLQPGHVAAAWERTADVLPRRQAAEEFAGAGHRWAEANLGDEDAAARLAELAGRISDAASVAGAPLFAGWRSLPEPTPDRPRALALHRMNGLRELRGALHAASVLASGITPFEAVVRRTPFMLPVFGWDKPEEDQLRAIKARVRETWALAQQATEAPIARAFEPLSPDERAEFVELARATQATVTGS